MSESVQVTVQWVTPVIPLYVAYYRFGDYLPRDPTPANFREMLEDIREELRDGVSVERVHAIGTPVDGDQDASLLYLVKDMIYASGSVYPFERAEDAKKWLAERLQGREIWVKRALEAAEASN